MGDILNFFLTNLFGDFFDHRRFVHLIGNFVDNNRVTVFANFLDPGFGADDNAATSLKIGFPRARAPKHRGSSREIRSRYIIDQLFAGQVRVFNQRKRGVDHFAQIVGWDIGGHTDGNPACAIDQHIWKPRGQNGWFAVFTVIIVLEIDGIFINVGQNKGCWLIHPDFSIAHRGWVITIH